MPKDSATSLIASVSIPRQGVAALIYHGPGRRTIFQRMDHIDPLHGFKRFHYGGRDLRERHQKNIVNHYKKTLYDVSPGNNFVWNKVCTIKYGKIDRYGFQRRKLNVLVTLRRLPIEIARSRDFKKLTYGSRQRSDVVIMVVLGGPITSSFQRSLLLCSYMDDTLKRRA